MGMIYDGPDEMSYDAAEQAADRYGVERQRSTTCGRLVGYDPDGRINACRLPEDHLGRCRHD